MIKTKLKNNVSINTQDTDKKSDNKKTEGLFSQFAIIGAGTIINMFIGFLTTPIITRLVIPEEYGQLSIFKMYASISVMVLCLGLDQALVRFYYNNDSIDYKRSLLKMTFFYPMIVAIIVGIIFLFFQYYEIIRFEFSFRISVLMVVFIILSIWHRFAILLLRINRDSKKYALCNILNKIIYVIFALAWILNIQERAVEGLCIATIIGVVIPGIIATKSTIKVWSFKRENNLENKKEILKYGLPLVLSMGLTNVFQAIDRMSLNHYCSYAEVGIYSSAMSIINIFAIIQTTFNSLWGPLITEKYTKEPEKTPSFIKKVNHIITIIMFFVGINILMFKDIFVLLLGEKYRYASSILPFLIFNPIMLTISETTHCGIGFTKKSYLNIIVSIVACVVNYCGNTLMVPYLGGKGAAISTGISYIVFLALRTMLSNKYYYVDYSLKKLSLMIISTSAFAALCTFYSVSILSLFLYIVCLLLLFLLYRDSWKILYTYLRGKIQKLK